MSPIDVKQLCECGEPMFLHETVFGVGGVLRRGRCALCPCQEFKPKVKKVKPVNEERA